jgi:anti-sigma factor RsiW
MTCNGARELIPLFVGGDLTEGRMAEVRDHLAQCADCARELQKFESCRELVAELRAPELSRSQVHEMWTAIRQEIALPAQPRVIRLNSAVLLKMAAVAVIGISVGYSAYGLVSAFAQPDVKAPAALTPVPPMSEAAKDLRADEVRPAGGPAELPPAAAPRHRVVITTPDQQRQELMLRKLEEEVQSLRRQVVDLQTQNTALTQRLIELSNEKK